MAAAVPLFTNHRLPLRGRDLLAFLRRANGFLEHRRAIFYANENPVAFADLPGNDLLGEPIQHIRLDRALQGARAVVRIESFLHEERMQLRRERNLDSLLRGALPHLIELDRNDALENSARE